METVTVVLVARGGGAEKVAGKGRSTSSYP
jgi:hypothetical protein